MRNVFIFFLLLKLFITECHAQDSFFREDSLDYSIESIKKGFIERHNYWRDKVGVPPLKWSSKLAKLSLRWANELVRRRCKISHSPRSGKFGNTYGENIHLAIGFKDSPIGAVDGWASEIKYFDEATGMCIGGKCGHYTQIVWRETAKVGCAVVQCGNTQIWVCQYDPHGNWVGKKPY